MSYWDTLISDWWNPRVIAFLIAPIIILGAIALVIWGISLISNSNYYDRKDRILNRVWGVALFALVAVILFFGIPFVNWLWALGFDS